jgi:hypothetical protein
MAREYKPQSDRQLAVGVIERGLTMRPIPGTRGQLQQLSRRELEYLRWLGEKVIAERERDGVA